MLPCYRENQTEKGDQSFLRMMAQKEEKNMVRKVFRKLVVKCNFPFYLIQITFT